MTAVVPRGLLDGYTAQLNALSEAGQRLVLRALANARWRTVAELRRIMSEAMEQVCSVVADDAAVLASEMYDDVRELCLGERLGTVPEGSYDPAATAGAVRALVGSVANTGGTERFGRELSARVDYEVKRAAGESVHRMGKRDPADVRFARIPSGVETCPFCLMLASRGFVYDSAQKAEFRKGGGHYHPHCDCRIVPGFGDTEVEGYDPDMLYRKWRRMVVEKEERKIRRDFNKAWAEFKKEKTPDNYDRTVRAYLKSLSPRLDAEYRAKPQPKEIQVGLWLVKDSRSSLRFNYENSSEGSRNPDVFWLGETWEIKRIESGRVGKVYDNARRGSEQSGNVIIDLSLRTLTVDEAKTKEEDIFKTLPVNKLLYLVEERIEIEKR